MRSAIVDQTWENENAPGGAGNTIRGLTHPDRLDRPEGSVKPTCSQPDCDRTAIARGLCPRCYMNAKRAGTIENHTGHQPKPCRVAACMKVPPSGDICSMHRARLERTGSTDARVPDQRARYEQFVDRRGPDECWPWTGTILNTGYGQVSVGGKKTGAHRLAYEVYVGPVPADLTIDHVWERGCRRTDCVNPAHLEAVTQAENTRRSNARRQRSSDGRLLPGLPKDGE